MTADQVFFQHFLGLLGGHLDVGNLLFARLHDLHDGLVLAQSDTAGLGYGDLVS